MPELKMNKNNWFILYSAVCFDLSSIKNNGADSLTIFCWTIMG